MPPARIAFIGLTIAALVQVGRGFFVGPPPAWLAAVAISFYVGVLLLGVFVLRLRMFVDAIVSGPRDASGVALTFDDGPDPESTPKVLDALDAARAKGTFFVIGKKAEKHPEIIRDILARGHAVGLHSYAHERLFAMRGPGHWRRDLKRGMAALEKITGERPTLFRPPIGHTNPQVGGVLRELGLVVVGWTVSARDGVRGKPEEVARRVLDGARDGAIVLMHDASERGDHAPAGVVALPQILAGLAKRKLAVTRLQEWIRL
jgi:peptidoglycan/xylan/chitin deacetylase (PgdA/CDA1 family)